MNTDLYLAQDVAAELIWDLSTTATRIHVRVSGGIVTLSGYVETYAEN